MAEAVKAIIAPQRPEQRSIIAKMAERYGMELKNFEATLRATVVPEKCSREEFAAFLLVADRYRLNPILREIYAFPKKGGGIQPIVGIDGWSNIINSHEQCDGFEFEDHTDVDGNLIAITCRVYRKDRSRPSEAREYMVECQRQTDTWRQWPRRMLRHKALIQAGRYAFGFTGIVDPDEYERASPDSVPPASIDVPPAPKDEPVAVETTTAPEPAPSEGDVIEDLRLALAGAKTAEQAADAYDELSERISLAGRRAWEQGRALLEERLEQLPKVIEAQATAAAAAASFVPATSGQLDMLAVPSAKEGVQS